MTLLNFTPLFHSFSDIFKKLCDNNGNYYIGIVQVRCFMNKRISMLFTIAAVAVMGATLFGSTYTQTQISGQSLDMTQNGCRCHGTNSSIWAVYNL